MAAANIEFLSQAAVDAELLFGYRDYGYGYRVCGGCLQKGRLGTLEMKDCVGLLLRKSSKSFASMAIVSGLGGC